jgi:two-component system, cell cycle response regulator
MTKKKILIVEDSPTQARYNAFILEDAGHEVSIATTGQMGIDMAKSIPLDLILLDVILPDMDGYKVCLEIRQLAASYIPILMLTSQKVAVEDKVDGFTAGADDYLNKPFDPRELLARVNALLRIKQMIDDMLSNLTHEHQAYQSLRRIALTDHLTKLYNRHYFAEALEREFSLAQRHNLPLSCIMTDIDHFREFNNRFGHAIGDMVLEETAKIFQDNQRKGDIIARYGGEEFVILLTITELDKAVAMAERLRTLVEEKVWESQAGELRITVSFGVSNMPATIIKSTDELVQNADKALFRAKGLGRNRVEVFTPELTINQ